MATHSSVLAWRIPGTGEPGGLPSVESHRVRHNWSDLAAALAPRKQRPQSYNTRNRAMPITWMNSEEDYKTKIINSPGLQYLNYSIQSCISGLDKELRIYMHAQLLQSCPTLCDTMDYGPPLSSVHGILQARILEWVAMPFSKIKDTCYFILILFFIEVQLIYNIMLVSGIQHIQYFHRLYPIKVITR